MGEVQGKASHNPSTPETETRDAANSNPVWPRDQMPGQPWPQRKALS